jgi:predicted CopG family antitoxin
MSSKLKQIAISHENYITLKKLGDAGDSFNDVISRILEKMDDIQYSDFKEGAKVKDLNQ